VRGDRGATTVRDGAPHAFLIPVKSFIDAKERLATVLGDSERSELARSLAEGVLRATAPVPTAVVCDDEDIAQWATERGATVVWTPHKGLNRAVAAGVEHLETAGFERITVVHADLPFPERLHSLPVAEGVLLVPDRRADGTNVLSLPASSGFEFSYGPSSFERHKAIAERLGLSIEVLMDDELSIDVDYPEDLELMRARTRRRGPEGPRTSPSG
jgi:2-phospho-L-lactate guanylyltransferase